MNNEYKTIDLCGRLPYGVFCLVPDYTDRPIRVTTVNALLDCVVFDGDITPLMYDDWLAYLRPIDSMTIEEREELDNIANNSPVSDGYVSMNIPHDIIPLVIAVDYTMCDAIITWLNAHHFDYRGLIEQGLALEAPEGMYNIK